VPTLGEQLAFATAAGTPARLDFQLELQVTCAPRAAAAPPRLERAAGPSLAEAGGPACEQLPDSVVSEHEPTSVQAVSGTSSS